MKRLLMIVPVVVFCAAAGGAAGQTDVRALDALNRGDIVAAMVCAGAEIREFPFSPAATIVFARAEQQPTWWLLLLRLQVVLGGLSLALAGLALLRAARRRIDWRRWWAMGVCALVAFGICWVAATTRTPLVVARNAPLRVSPQPEAPAQETLAAGQFVLVREQRKGYALLSWPAVGWISVDHLYPATTSECAHVTERRQVSQFRDE